MTEHWEHQQLPRCEIEKMREEANQANTQLEIARQAIIDKEKQTSNNTEK